MRVLCKLMLYQSGLILFTQKLTKIWTSFCTASYIYIKYKTCHKVQGFHSVFCRGNIFPLLLAHDCLVKKYEIGPWPRPLNGHFQFKKKCLTLHWGDGFVAEKLTDQNWTLCQQLKVGAINQFLIFPVLFLLFFKKIFLFALFTILAWFAFC